MGEKSMLDSLNSATLSNLGDFGSSLIDTAKEIGSGIAKAADGAVHLDGEKALEGVTEAGFGAMDVVSLPFLGVRAGVAAQTGLISDMSEKASEAAKEYFGEDSTAARIAETVSHSNDLMGDLMNKTLNFEGPLVDGAIGGVMGAYYGGKEALEEGGSVLDAVKAAGEGLATDAQTDYLASIAEDEELAGKVEKVLDSGVETGQAIARDRAEAAAEKQETQGETFKLSEVVSGGVRDLGIIMDDYQMGMR